MNEKILAALEDRHECGGVEASKQHVLAAARIGPEGARFIGVSDDGPLALIG